MAENTTDETTAQQYDSCPDPKISDDLDIDPDAIEIGDELHIEEGASALAVVGVDTEEQQVRVYSPPTEEFVDRWVAMEVFSVHSPNEDIQTDAEREEWLNKTLRSRPRISTAKCTHSGTPSTRTGT